MGPVVVTDIDVVVVCSVDVITVVMSHSFIHPETKSLVVDHSVVVVVSMVDVFIVVVKSTVDSVVESDSDDSSVNVVDPIVVVSPVDSVFNVENFDGNGVGGLQGSSEGAQRRVRHIRLFLGNFLVVPIIVSL